MIRLSPQQLVFGGASTASGVGMYPIVDLYNDSSGDEYVVVLAIFGVGTNSATNVLGIVKGNINNPVGGETNVLVNAGKRAGQLHANQQSLSTGFTMPAPSSFIAPVVSAVRAPLAILLPGYSFRISNSVTNSTTTVALWWAGVHRSDVWGD